MTQVVRMGRVLALAALLVPGAAAVGQENSDPSRPSQTPPQGVGGLPSGSVTLPGGAPSIGMVGGGATHMAATARHVYVLRGGRLYAFDSRSLQMTGTAELPALGSREAVAGARSDSAVPDVSVRLRGPDGSPVPATPPGATGRTDGAGTGAGGAAGADRGTGATGRIGDAAAGNAAGAGGGLTGPRDRGAAGTGAGRAPGTGQIGGTFGHGQGGPGAGSMAGSPWPSGMDSIRLVATDRAVYVLNGEQLVAFEAGTLRRMGTAVVPTGAGGAAGGIGAGSDRFAAPGGAGGATGGSSGGATGGAGTPNQR